MVTLGLAKRGIVPKTARTIAALTALYLIWEVASYVAVPIGSATLAESAGPPPFLLGILWAVLVARLWRRMRTRPS